MQPSPNFAHFVNCKITWHLTNTQKYVKCLQLLQSKFTDRFSEFHNKRTWLSLILNPFLVEVGLSNCLSYIDEANIAVEQLGITDLKSNDILRCTYKTSESLLEFWNHIIYQTTLKRVAFIVLSMSGSTYCFEQTFKAD